VNFALGESEACEVAALRRMLELNSGYLSRILARFEADGLLTRRRSRTDGRRQVVRLTTQGREVCARLDRGSADAVRTLLAGLGRDEQQALVTALTTADALMTRRGNGPVVVRPPAAGELGWIVARHGVLCAHEGDSRAAEVAAARIVTTVAERHDVRREGLWVAQLAGRPGGSAVCLDEAVDTGRRDGSDARRALLLVEPEHRGQGVGRALIEQCVRVARDAGYRRLVVRPEPGLLGAAGPRLVDGPAAALFARAGFVPATGPRHDGWELGLRR
jgi:DNA-binding MarR family transcriptional regulator